MLFDLSSLAPLLFLCGFYLAVVPTLDLRNDRARLLISLATGFIGLRYVMWRLFDTVLPVDGTAAEVAWVWAVWCVEILAFVEVAIFLLIMSRGNCESDLADLRQRELEAHAVWPKVDVLIPTYNEGLDVLEKSIIGARAMDYPNFGVYVLDDGRREWLRAYCREKGVGYITRPDNAHAKAGNLNNGLDHTDGDLIAVFDADFVAHRNFLRRTVGLFADPTVGIVQTPQHFFNKDPVQMNLRIAQDWPDEQRLFFDEIAASRDAWGAAFCCGSCSVMRRAALDAIGGVPTSSITEDLLTTLAMFRKGWVTRYLNEKLSMGLAAEGLEAFFIQRTRWCQGGIQTIFLPDGPLGRGISPLHRLLFFPVSWVVQYPVRFMILVVPIVFLFTGMLPLHFTSIQDLLYYQAPLLIGYALSMRWLSGGKYMPLLSNAIGIFSTFRLLPTVFSSMVRPFGRPFRVTPKGRRSRSGVDWISFTAIMFVGGLTALGLLINSFPGLQMIAEREFFPVAAAWALFNLVTLVLASLICFDASRKRKEERFVIDRPAAARIALRDGDFFPVARPVRVIDMSLNGVSLDMGDVEPKLSRIELMVNGVDGILTGEIVGPHGEGCVMRFDVLPVETRDSLIAYLYSGTFDNDAPPERRRKHLWRHLWRRFVGNPA